MGIVIACKDYILEAVGSQEEESYEWKEQECKFDDLRLIFCAYFPDFSVFDIGIRELRGGSECMPVIELCAAIGLALTFLYFEKAH